MHLFEEGYFGLCRYNPAEAVVSMVIDARRTQDPLSLARRGLPHLPEQAWLRMNPISRGPARLGVGAFWLAGDAARVVEPFTGEGIFFALSTGLLAAEAALAGLGTERFGCGRSATTAGATGTCTAAARGSIPRALLLVNPLRTVARAAGRKAGSRPVFFPSCAGARDLGTKKRRITGPLF